MRSADKFLEKAQESINTALVAIAQAKTHISDSLLKSEGDAFLKRRDQCLNMQNRLSNIADKLTYVSNGIPEL